MGRPLPRQLPGRHAVRRGHLLLQGEDGALYAHRIKESGVTRVEHAGEKVLVEGLSRGWGGAKTPADAATPCRGGGERTRVKRESVVPIMGIVALPCSRDRPKKSDGERVDHHGEKARTESPARGGGRDAVRKFGYVEAVSTAPSAQCLGRCVTLDAVKLPCLTGGRAASPAAALLATGRGALAAAGGQRPVRSQGQEEQCCCRVLLNLER